MRVRSVFGYWKEVRKFLSGAFFISAGVNAYFYVTWPFLGLPFCQNCWDCGASSTSCSCSFLFASTLGSYGLNLASLADSEFSYWDEGLSCRPHPLFRATRAMAAFGTFRTYGHFCYQVAKRTSIVRTVTAASRAPVRWPDPAMVW